MPEPVISGLLESVTTDYARNFLAVDAVAAATVVTVQNGAVFATEDDTGQVSIDYVTYAYVLDPDTDTLTLTPGLATDLEEGEPVEVYPPVQETTAQVTLLGSEEIIEALVALHHVSMLTKGTRDADARELVTLYKEGLRYATLNFPNETPEFRIEGHPNEDDEYGGVVIRTDELNGIVELTSDGAVAWSLSGGTGADEAAYVSGSTHFNDAVVLGSSSSIQADTDLHITAGDSSTVIVSGMGQWSEFIQAGTEPITPVANTPTSVDLTFPTEFDAAPTVVVTALTVVPGSTVTGVSVSDIDEIGCKLWINRTNNTVTYLHWIATRA